jgi:hypothetical protein
LFNYLLHLLQLLYKITYLILILQTNQAGMDGKLLNELHALKRAITIIYYYQLYRKAYKNLVKNVIKESKTILGHSPDRISGTRDGRGPGPALPEPLFSGTDLMI